jgi:hypothetical protein
VEDLWKKMNVERPTSNVEGEKLKKQIKEPELVSDILNEIKLQSGATSLFDVQSV